MNDFALTSNRTIVLPLGDELIEIKQVVMSELDRFLTDALPIKKDIAALESKEIIDITRVFLSHAVHTVALLSLLTTMTTERLTELANEQPELLSHVIYALYIQNSAFFDEIDPQRTQKKSKNTWFDGFQFLISQGHTHSEIMQYSYGAYVGYCQAAGRSHNRQLAALAGAMRTAHHADKNGMDKFYRAMSD